MQFQSIQIDFEVHRAIEQQRKSFEDTPNDVLRRVFRIATSLQDAGATVDPNKSAASNNSPRPAVANAYVGSGLITRTCTIPNGTRLRKILKGELHEAEVREGFICYKGKKYDAPSAAGVAASGTSVNGWVFWDYFDIQKNRWLPLDNLRRKGV